MTVILGEYMMEWWMEQLMEILRESMWGGEMGLWYWVVQMVTEMDYSWEGWTVLTTE